MHTIIIYAKILKILIIEITFYVYHAFLCPNVIFYDELMPNWHRNIAKKCPKRHTSDKYKRKEHAENSLQNFIIIH